LASPWIVGYDKALQDVLRICVAFGRRKLPWQAVAGVRDEEQESQSGKNFLCPIVNNLHSFA
jgi:hypothetical protein